MIDQVDQHQVYIKWCKEQLKLEFPNGELSIKSLNTEGTERGIISHDLKKDGPSLVKLPFDSIMTILSTKGTPLESLISACREDDLLSIFLLYEKFERKNNSKWHNHIEILPETYHNIANYTDQELDNYIKGSNLYYVAKKWKKQISTDFLDLKSNLAANTVNLKMDISSQPSFTFNNYLWALSTIWSRFISIQRVDKTSRSIVFYKGMVPFVDIFNHTSTSKCSHMFSERNNQFTVIRDKSQQFNSGEEISLNYGLVPNSKLLMLYGFALLDNTSGSVDVYVSMNNVVDEVNVRNHDNMTTTSTVSVNTVKLEALKRIGITEFEEPFQIYENVFPIKLMYFLRIQHYGENIESKDSHNYTVDTLVQESQKSSSTYTEKKSCRVLVSTLESMLRLYNTTFDEDEMKLKLWGLLPLPRAQTQQQAQALEGQSDVSGQTVAADDVTPLIHSIEATVFRNSNNKKKDDADAAEPESSTQHLQSQVFVAPQEREKNSLIMVYSEKKVLKSVIYLIKAHYRTVFGEDM